MEYRDGDVYVGDWSNGAQTGGEMTYANGSVYTGDFKNGGPEGKGKITYANI